MTGIHGLDEILRGGIPYGSTVLASGTCGSGKTTLGMEFLVRGALAGEACAHFTATEPSVKLLENIRQYAFFDMNMVDTGLINVFDMDVLYSWLGLDKSTFDLDDVHALIKAITDIVNTIGVTRLVIDSPTPTEFMKHLLVQRTHHRALDRFERTMPSKTSCSFRPIR